MLLGAWGACARRSTKGWAMPSPWRPFPLGSGAVQAGSLARCRLLLQRLAIWPSTALTLRASPAVPQGLESLLPVGSGGPRRAQPAAGAARGRDENASPERSHSPFLLGGSNSGVAAAAAPRKAAAEPAVVAAIGLPVPGHTLAGLHSGHPVVHPTSVEVGGSRSSGGSFDPW